MAPARYDVEFWSHLSFPWKQWFAGRHEPAAAQLRPYFGPGMPAATFGSPDHVENAENSVATSVCTRP